MTIPSVLKGVGLEAVSVERVCKEHKESNFS